MFCTFLWTLFGHFLALCDDITTATVHLRRGLTPQVRYLKKLTMPRFSTYHEVWFHKILSVRPTVNLDFLILCTGNFEEIVPFFPKHVKIGHQMT